MISMRLVTAGDLGIICSHRRRMHAENGATEATLDAAEEPFALWLRARLEDGSYFGFLAEEDGTVVGGIGLRVLDWPPGPNHPTSDKRGYVFNVFVEPASRGRGIASKLMRQADETFRALGISYEMLHATEAGRRVYERLGWTASPEMTKVLR